MHRKSLEAAEHLKDQDNCNSNSDHEETTSMRTEASDTSATSTQPNQPNASQSTTSPTGEKDHPQQHNYPEDPEAFRNNSIACLRAKAQEHSAKLLNHGIMLQVRSNLGQSGCDANANNLHHQDVANSDTNSSVF